MKIRLNREWSLLLERYKGDHRDRRNQATHMIGIPMIVASLPMMASIVALPAGATLFTVGWGFQFLGHYFEGNDPAFFSDRRSLIVGVLWCAEKYGLAELELEGAKPARAAEPSVATA
ncbi:MAG: DUF962 domain-containing protein [Sandaracinus sp.]